MEEKSAETFGRGRGVQEERDWRVIGCIMCKKGRMGAMHGVREDDCHPQKFQAYDANAPSRSFDLLPSRRIPMVPPFSAATARHDPTHPHARRDTPRVTRPCTSRTLSFLFSPSSSTVRCVFCAPRRVSHPPRIRSFAHRSLPLAHTIDLRGRRTDALVFSFEVNLAGSPSKLSDELSEPSRCERHSSASRRIRFDGHGHGRGRLCASKGDVGKKGDGMEGFWSKREVQKRRGWSDMATWPCGNGRRIRPRRRSTWRWTSAKQQHADESGQSKVRRRGGMEECTAPSGCGVVRPRRRSRRGLDE